MFSFNITKNSTASFNANYTAIYALKKFFLFHSLMNLIYKLKYIVNFNKQFNLIHLYYKIRKCNHLVKEDYGTLLFPDQHDKISFKIC